jgi:hypothetical protein
VTASAATIRLEVLDMPQTGKLLDLAIGELTATAVAPHGGLLPPQIPGQGASPGDPADGSGDAGGDSALPVTGTSLSLMLGAGLALVLLGRFAMVMARRFR